MVAERLQEPSRRGDGGAAFRVVEVVRVAGGVEKADPQPARIGADLVAQWTRQGGGVVGLTRHRGADDVEDSGGVSDRAGDRTVDGPAGPAFTDQGTLAHPRARRLEPDQPALASGDADG